MKRLFGVSVCTFFALTTLSGCTNMPTPPSEITATYVSPLKYENVDCARLSSELASLSNRESELAIAQNKRIDGSALQVFVYGVGPGDGIEANELANVRGEKSAVRNAMKTKSCS